MGQLLRTCVCLLTLIVTAQCFYGRPHSAGKQKTQQSGARSLGLFFLFGDMNNDLLLDSEELARLFTADAYLGQSDVIAYVLMEFDDDGDNKLSVAELQDALKLSENEFRRLMA